MRVWRASHFGSWHLFSHSHGNLPELQGALSFDVGVDCHDFEPIAYEQVKARMAKKSISLKEG
jgi:calcineurin-like phosphoesterase family protein